MLDEQRVADMSSKGGIGLAAMVAKQLSPETFTHHDGRVLKMPQRTERVYKPYHPHLCQRSHLSIKSWQRFC